MTLTGLVSLTTVLGLGLAAESETLATAVAKPVKVFVLAGQSNMLGHGRVAMDKPGDLADAADQEQFGYLRDGDQWRERDDVWYVHTTGKGQLIKGNLRIGLGANEQSVGPELAFGHVLGDAFEEQVLLIKTAWGGQALAVTFRPPNAGLPDEPALQDMLKKAQKKNPQATLESIRDNFGSRYRQMLSEVRGALDNLDDHFPSYQGQGTEIAGFFWHQGWNDGCSKEQSAEYESNMVHFIHDLRSDLGDDALPFVIATSGMGGPDATGVAGWLAKGIEPKQVAAAEKFKRCVAVPTRHFQRSQPGRQKSHWYNSAESYCLVGDASARAMLEILGVESGK